MEKQIKQIYWITLIDYYKVASKFLHNLAFSAIGMLFLLNLKQRRGYIFSFNISILNLPKISDTIYYNIIKCQI